MKETTYFVRWRGEVSGPYDISVLKDMLATGKITKHHQVSADRQSWMKIMKALDAAPPQSMSAKEDTAFQRIDLSPVVETAQDRPENHSAEMDHILGDESLPVLESPNYGVRMAGRDREPAPLPSPESLGTWYYFSGGQVCGPVAFSVLQSMAAKGFLPQNSQILREGDQTWQPLNQVVGMADGVVGFINQATDGTHGYGCDPMVPAGFWQRTLALTIDSAVLGCICSVCLFLLFLLLSFCGLGKSDIIVLIKGFGSVISILIMWIYFTCLESSSNVTTFGKMAVDITVVDECGQPILYGRSNARFFCKLLSSFFLIGFVMAAFTKRKQALHDLIARTLVIKVNNDR